MHNAKSFLGGTSHLWAKCNHGKFQIAQSVFFSFGKYQCFKRTGRLEPQQALRESFVLQAAEMQLLLQQAPSPGRLVLKVLERVKPVPFICVVTFLRVSQHCCPVSGQGCGRILLRLSLGPKASGKMGVPITCPPVTSPDSDPVTSGACCHGRGLAWVIWSVPTSKV